MGLFFGVMAGVMLFLHGLAAFTDEVRRLGGQRLRRVLRRLTSNDVTAAISGACSTALLQSSTAVSSMAMSLCDAGSLTTRGAAGILLGANVGTTLTAWLVAFKVTGLGPVFVTAGGLWSLVGPRPWRTYGKPVFYFGLIFLALDEVASQLRPLGESGALREPWEALQSPGIALLLGLLATVVVQSSSVVVGMAVIAVAGGLGSVEQAAWLVVGANLGTMSTVLAISSGLEGAARRLALLNAAFNGLALALFLLVLRPLLPSLVGWVETPGQQVAMIHTVYNLAAAILALVVLPRVWPRLEAFLDGESSHSPT